MVDEEVIMICIDNSKWMKQQPDEFRLQLEALLLYCHANIQSNPKNAIGLITMRTAKHPYSLKPTSDLSKILSSIRRVFDAFIGGELDFYTAFYNSVVYLECGAVPPIPPTTQKRLLIFTGGPINLNPELADQWGKFLVERGIAVDHVNFSLEEQHCYNRKVRDAFSATFKDDNKSHFKDPKAGDCMRHILSSPPAIIPRALLEEEAAAGNLKAKDPKGKNQAAAYDDPMKLLKMWGKKGKMVVF